MASMSLQQAMDITQAASGQSPQQKLKEEENKPKGLFRSCNHSWHWAEVMFLVLGPGGIIMFVVGVTSIGTTMHWLFGLIFLFAALVGCGFNWNLATQKRLAKSVRLLGQSIREIVSLNLTMANDIKELAHTKEEFTRRNHQLRENVKRLDGSVHSLKDIEANLNKVLAQQREIIQVRQKNNERLDELLAKEDELALDSARNWMLRRIQGQFESADHDNSGSVDLDGEEWKSLQAYLAENGFFLEAADVDRDGDGQIRRIELLRAIQDSMDERFHKIKRSLQRQRDLARRLADKRKELDRKRRRM